MLLLKEINRLLVKENTSNSIWKMTEGDVQMQDCLLKH